MADDEHVGPAGPLGDAARRPQLGEPGVDLAQRHEVGPEHVPCAALLRRRSAAIAHAMAASHTARDSAQRPSPISAPPSDPSTRARSGVGGSARHEADRLACEARAAAPSPRLHWR